MLRQGAGWSGDVLGREEESSLGLRRYFFDDGIGIKRYESWTAERYSERRNDVRSLNMFVEIVLGIDGSER